MPRILSLLFLSLFALSACNAPPKSAQYQIYVFGTLVDVTLFGAEKEAQQ